MANKQINQLPGAANLVGSDNLPIQDIDGTTKRIAANQIAEFIGTATTPGLSDVLAQDNYANGYPIILNANAKITSDNQNGVDFLQINPGYVNLESVSDGNLDSTQLYLAPTETAIKKTNYQTGTPEANILLNRVGINISTSSIDGSQINDIVYSNDGNNTSLYKFVGPSGDSWIESNSQLSDTRANKVDLYYTKGVNGEFLLQKDYDTTYYRSTVTNSNGNQSSFLQDAIQIISTSKYFSINSESSSIRDTDQTLSIENINQLSLQSNIITLSKSSGTNLRLFISNLQVFANNNAALAAGLVATEVYRKSTGELMIVH
jgi:hypothetical protein